MLGPGPEARGPRSAGARCPRPGARGGHPSFGARGPHGPDFLGILICHVPFWPPLPMFENTESCRGVLHIHRIGLISMQNLCTVHNDSESQVGTLCKFRPKCPRGVCALVQPLSYLPSDAVHEGAESEVGTLLVPATAGARGPGSEARRGSPGPAARGTRGDRPSGARGPHGVRAEAQGDRPHVCLRGSWPPQMRAQKYEN